jgi:hypothetical protein
MHKKTKNNWSKMAHSLGYGHRRRFIQQRLAVLLSKTTVEVKLGLERNQRRARVSIVVAAAAAAVESGL